MTASDPRVWEFADRRIVLDRPLIMAILNVTPDSFSDGGELTTVAQAVDRAGAAVEAGARLLDVGGESTRPGASEISGGEEMDRVLPVVEALVARFGVPVSVDTRKAVVAREALGAGASVVNDVSGLAYDEALGPAIRDAGAGVVLMHMRGDPDTMQEHAVYDDVVRDVTDELEEALGRADAAGVPRAATVVDPGIGFAKTADQSLRLLKEVDALARLGRPVAVGPSRKSFLGAVLGVPPKERVVGTATACALAYERGARIFRVHDVGEVAHALRVAEATLEGLPDGPSARRNERKGSGPWTNSSS